jgi:hypothetical protein
MREEGREGRWVGSLKRKEKKRWDGWAETTTRRRRRRRTKEMESQWN